VERAKKELGSKKHFYGIGPEDKVRFWEDVWVD